MRRNYVTGPELVSFVLATGTAMAMLGRSCRGVNEVEQVLALCLRITVMVAPTLRPGVAPLT